MTSPKPRTDDVFVPVPLRWSVIVPGDIVMRFERGGKVPVPQLWMIETIDPTPKSKLADEVKAIPHITVRAVCGPNWDETIVIASGSVPVLIGFDEARGLRSLREALGAQITQDRRTIPGTGHGNVSR